MNVRKVRGSNPRSSKKIDRGCDAVVACSLRKEFHFWFYHVQIDMRHPGDERMEPRSSLRWLPCSQRTALLDVQRLLQCVICELLLHLSREYPQVQHLDTQSAKLTRWTTVTCVIHVAHNNRACKALRRPRCPPWHPCTALCCQTATSAHSPPIASWHPSCLHRFSGVQTC